MSSAAGMIETALAPLRSRRAAYLFAAVAIALLPLVFTYQILLNWISLTQGPLGIYAIPPPPALALPGLPVIGFRNLANLFYLVAGFALLAYFLLDQLIRSPIGETLTAIREDEVSAA